MANGWKKVIQLDAKKIGENISKKPGSVIKVGTKLVKVIGRNKDSENDRLWVVEV